MRTLEEFIKLAKAKHNNYYSYEKVISYDGSFEKIIVTCPIHGDFETTPARHLSGCGCPMCAREHTSKVMRKSTEEFIKDSKAIHGDKYNYDETVYTGRRKLLKIICPIHGLQEMTAENHLRGCGCPECSHKQAGDSKRFSVDKFIEMSREVHGDRYDYSKSNYVSMKTKLTITCPIHGDFTQSPHDHIKNRTGCPICRSSKMEIDLRNKLIDCNIKFEEQKTWDWLVYKTKQYADFYLPDFNIVIECQGLQHFSEVKFFNPLDYTQDRDRNKKALCTEHGIRILYYSNLGENFEYPYEVFTNLDDLMCELKKDRPD